jgi:tripartite-type tricarboxylate transporter receptor subunit TctC
LSTTRPRRGLLAALLLLAASPDVKAAESEVPALFQNKTVTLDVSAGAGGGYDLYARTFAMFLGRHLPGQPRVVVQNMIGAGGLRAASYIYGAAPKDGSEIALIQSTALMGPYFGVAAAHFNPTKFVWLGNLSKEYSVCAACSASPIRTVEDMFERQFVVGSSGAGTSMETYPNVLNAVLGTKIKIISGYSGGAAVFLAMERGEVQGRCGASYDTYKAVRPDWVKNGSVRFLLQTSLEKDPQLPDTPWIMNFVKTERQRDILNLILAPRLVQRPLVAPPGIPPATAAALRDAVAATMADKEFLTTAARVTLDIEPMTADEVSNVVDNLAKTPDDVRLTAAKAADGGQ